MQVNDNNMGHINVSTSVKSKFYDGAVSAAAGVFFNGKVMIINGFGIYFDAGTTFGSSYSGIQTK